MVKADDCVPPIRGRKTEDTTAFEAMAKQALVERVVYRTEGWQESMPDKPVEQRTQEDAQARYASIEEREDEEVTLWGDIDDDDIEKAHPAFRFMADPDYHPFGIDHESEPKTPPAKILDAGEYDAETGRKPGVWATMGERLYEQHRGAGTRDEDEEQE